jgi:hypothetical protein
MFDEEGERILHKTDLHDRLTEALDSPNAWIRWDLARAMARNIKFKLEEPPQRAIPAEFWDRVRAELAAFMHHFPSLPPEWLSGDRIDDPTVCSHCILLNTLSQPMCSVYLVRRSVFSSEGKHVSMSGCL